MNFFSLEVFLSERKWSFIANKKAQTPTTTNFFQSRLGKFLHLLINYLLQVKSTFYYHWKEVAARNSYKYGKAFYTCVYCSVWDIFEVVMLVSSNKCKDSLWLAFYTCIYSRCRLMWSLWPRPKVLDNMSQNTFHW